MPFHQNGHVDAVALSYSSSAMAPLSPGIPRRYAGGTSAGVASSTPKYSSYRPSSIVSSSIHERPAYRSNALSDYTKSSYSLSRLPPSSYSDSAHRYTPNSSSLSSSTGSSIGRSSSGSSSGSLDLSKYSPQHYVPNIQRSSLLASSSGSSSSGGSASSVSSGLSRSSAVDLLAGGDELSSGSAISRSKADAPSSSLLWTKQVKRERNNNEDQRDGYRDEDFDCDGEPSANARSSFGAAPQESNNNDAAARSQANNTRGIRTVAPQLRGAGGVQQSGGKLASVASGTISGSSVVASGGNQTRAATKLTSNTELQLAPPSSTANTTNNNAPIQAAAASVQGGPARYSSLHSHALQQEQTQPPTLAINGALLLDQNGSASSSSSSSSSGSECGKSSGGARSGGGRGSRDERCGLNGLRNIGNTCFMNSVIQCMSNTRPLLEYLLNEQYLSDINTSTSSMKGALIKAFSQVIQELWDHDGDHVVNTSSLKSQIQRFAPRFIGYSQQDAQEFLRYLLEGLHEDVNRVTVKPQPIHTDIPDSYSDSMKAAESWKRYLRSEDSTIVDVFVGQLRSSLRCTVCDHVSVTLDPFWDLSLPIPSRSGTVKLSQCLEHFTKEEVMDGDEKPTCSKCQMRRKCTKSFSIQKFPKILVIHLKRFSPMERFRGKLNVLVDFPLTSLDLGAYAAPRVPGCTYNLYGVANHSGTTHSGHYTAYCKHPYSGEWHEYNDSRVTPVSARSVVSCEGYVLFYEQQPQSSHL